MLFTDWLLWIILFKMQHVHQKLKYIYVLRNLWRIGLSAKKAFWSIVKWDTDFETFQWLNLLKHAICTITNFFFGNFMGIEMKFNMQHTWNLNEIYLLNSVLSVTIIMLQYFQICNKKIANCYFHLGYILEVAANKFCELLENIRFNTNSHR